jgi:hypothetical protein
MVGPRRSAARQADPGSPAADSPLQGGNGDASELSQVTQGATSHGVVQQDANGTRSSSSTRPEQDGPAQLSRRADRSALCGAPASRIKVLGCNVDDPHSMQGHEIARIVVLFWALRMPPVLLVAAVVYSHNLKTIRAYADKLQLNSGELITVAACVAVFIVLAITLNISRKWQRGAGPDREE